MALGILRLSTTCTPPILEATGVDFDRDVEYADDRKADLGHGHQWAVLVV